GIRVPLAVIFGDLDKIASAKSTSSIQRRVKSAYFVWRPVKDNSHLELTMGYDLAQICEDVRDLVEYAAARERPRSSACPARPGTRANLPGSFPACYRSEVHIRVLALVAIPAAGG